LAPFTAFDEDVRLNIAAAALSCRGTRFGGRADLNVRWADVVLDNATFVQRARLAGAEPFSATDDSPVGLPRVDQFLDLKPRPWPRLLSMRNASIENLALENIDLRRHDANTSSKGSKPFLRAKRKSTAVVRSTAIEIVPSHSPIALA
jgi:hypothetical protein